MRLRDLRDDDLPTVFEFQREPAAVAMAGVPARDAEAFGEHWARIRADPTNVLRVIEADGDVAGTAVSFVLDGRRLVGYWLGTAFWGRGIASAAFPQLVAEISERPLWATVLTANAGSRRILEKSGFLLADQNPGGEELLYVLEAPVSGT